MRKLSKLAAIFAAFILACAFIGCDNPSNSYNMHYFFTDYGTNSAMIRTADNSDVAILSTTESGKGISILYEGTFVTLTKTVNGNYYTFTGSKGDTIYSVTGNLTNTSNGTTNDSFTIQSSSDAMKTLGFTSGKSIQHWTEKNSGVFVY